ncbi:MAG: hypothetical protein IPM51_16155 [Sphingobacteriaceae bacterium]|nr:hypothetical protein [Sphingobacteriaceae bacterium]
MKTTLQHFNPVHFLIAKSRLILAFGILSQVFISIPFSSFLITLALLVTLTFDLMDAYLARKHKLYSRKLRQYSAQTGLFFWLSVFFYLAFNETEFIQSNMTLLLILLVLEMGLHLLCYIKFKNHLALNTYAIKVRSVLFVLVVLNRLVGNEAQIVFNVAFVWTLISQIESFYILIKIKQYRVDVKSVFQL